jgi:hypothetical protein
LVVEGEEAHWLRVVAGHFDCHCCPAAVDATIGRIECGGQFLAEALDAGDARSERGQHLEAHPARRDRTACYVGRDFVQGQHGLDAVSLEFQLLAHLYFSSPASMK